QQPFRGVSHTGVAFMAMYTLNAFALRQTFSLLSPSRSTVAMASALIQHPRTASAGPIDKERGQPNVPVRTSLARSSSSVLRSAGRPSVQCMNLMVSNLILSGLLLLAGCQSPQGRFCQNEALRQELLEMVAVDQKAREGFGPRMTKRRRDRCKRSMPLTWLD